MSGIVGFENLLENGTVVASSVNANFPVANLFDWRTSDFFKPATSGTINVDLTLTDAASADFFAFYGHDLHKHGGTVQLQYWDGSGYVDCFSAVTPTDSRAQLIPFASQTSAKWRIVFVCTSVFSIAVACFGSRLVVDRGLYIGWTVPKFGRDTRVVDSVSDGGQFLGRSIISTGIKTTLEISHAPESWMDTNYLHFIGHAEGKPFFFLPQPVMRPSDAAFVWTDGAIPAPSPASYGHQSVSIPIRGLVE